MAKVPHVSGGGVPSPLLPIEKENNFPHNTM
nr:MAG TPA: hypothetical protein [Caudoviricetes sp.]